MSKEIKHLILDYFFGLCDEKELSEVERAVREDTGCSKFYNGLNKTIGCLKTLPKIECPDEVVTRMFEKIKTKTASQRDLESLLKSEYKGGFGRNYAFVMKISKIAAVIAVIIAIGAAYMPATKRMRFIALNNLCQRNLANIGGAMATYAADNAGMLPSVEQANGSPWWKVGSQNETDHSNTRNIWLLVRNGYSDINDFACPARPVISEARLETVNVCDYQKDFPSKDFVNYSFRVLDNKPARAANMSRGVIAADSNPIFEENYMNKYSFFKSFRLDERLINARSINHSGRGQNVMLIDNSVNFSRERMLQGDDIYTIRGEYMYSGNERPADRSDVFLAP